MKAKSRQSFRVWCCNLSHDREASRRDQVSWCFRSPIASQMVGTTRCVNLASGVGSGRTDSWLRRFISLAILDRGWLDRWRNSYVDDVASVGCLLCIERKGTSNSYLWRTSALNQQMGDPDEGAKGRVSCQRVNLRLQAWMYEKLLPSWSC